MQTDANHKRIKILWVKMGGLWPVNSGGRLRSFHIINELSKHNDVTVLTSHAAGEDGEILREHLPHCKQLVSIEFTPPKKSSGKFILSLMASWFSRLPVDIYKYQCRELKREAGRLLHDCDYDLCIADFLTAVPNVPAGGKVPVILFSHNVEYMIWQRLYNTETSWIKKLLLAIEWRKMRRFETRACNTCSATIAVSQEDAMLLANNSPAALITSVPTGVDTAYFSPQPSAQIKPRALVFSGSMDWFPNEDAMLYFINEVLPMVRSQVEDVSLTIVGRNPSDRLRRVASDNNVEVTGTVADIRPWLANAEIYIVPLRIGGGTRLKIYEALAMGVPVISTTVGAEGLALEDGVHIVRADDSQHFSQQICTLFEQPARRAELICNGRDLVVEKYSWSRIAREFESHCRDALCREPVVRHSPEYSENSAIASELKR